VSFTLNRCQPAAAPLSTHPTSVTDVLSSFIFQLMLGVLLRMLRRKLRWWVGGL